MAWIELHQGLSQHRKLLRLKSMLKIGRPQAMGHLCLLWCWALDNAPDGDLSDMASEEIAEVCDWTGEADALLQALLAAGLLDTDMRIHDWQDYAGRLIEKRTADAERKRAMRGVMKRDDTVQRMSGGQGADTSKTAQDIRPTAQDLRPTAQDLRPTAQDLRPTAQVTVPIPYPTVPDQIEKEKESRVRACEPIVIKEPNEADGTPRERALAVALCCCDDSKQLPGSYKRRLFAAIDAGMQPETVALAADEATARALPHQRLVYLCSVVENWCKAGAFTPESVAALQKQFTSQLAKKQPRGALTKVVDAQKYTQREYSEADFAYLFENNPVLQGDLPEMSQGSG